MATSSQYRDLILKLLPRGRAWTRDPDSWLFKFSWAMGEELARVDGRVRDMLQEIDPRYTSELLPEYEREYGLPDECSVLATSDAQRRQDLISRITAYGGQSAAYFISVLSGAGTPITITYGQPARANHTRAGDRAYGPGYLYVWNVNIPQGTTNYFITGLNVAGDPLSSVTDDTNVVCFIEKNKPAHTYVTYTFVT